VLAIDENAGLLNDNTARYSAGGIENAGQRWDGLSLAVGWGIGVVP
jgi:hypothetical protein